MKIFVLAEFFNNLKIFFRLDPRKKHIEKTGKMDVYKTASKLCNELLEIYFDEYCEYFFKF